MGLGQVSARTLLDTTPLSTTDLFLYLPVTIYDMNNKRQFQINLVFATCMIHCRVEVVMIPEGALDLEKSRHVPLKWVEVFPTY